MKICSPKGEILKYPSIRKLYIETNLSETMVRRLISKEISSYKEWKITKC
jgi:hypothetical protein